MKNNDLFKVAKWELRQNLMTKQFLVMTVVIPLMIGFFAGIPILIEHLTGDQVRRIAVVDESGLIYADLSLRLVDTSVQLFKPDIAPDELRLQVEAGDIDGLLVIGSEILTTNIVHLHVRDIGMLEMGELRRELTSVITEQRLTQAGYDPAKIRKITAAVVMLPVLVGAEEIGFAAIGVPIGIATLLIIATMISGGMLTQSVIKEKDNRVVELIMSSVSPRDFMVGKILGYGATSLVQLTIWVAIALPIASHYFNIPLGIVTWSQWIIYLAYFVLGYLLTATLYATMGAAMKDAQSGSQLQGIIGMLPAVPLFILSVIIASPDLLWIRIMGFIPPFTPGVMLLRMAAGRVLWWEIALSLILLAGFVYLLMRLAAKIFQVGILMYGKSANLAEMWRWVKSS
ncbi:ABC transporter permease [Candidatus Bipolaricaulota bacterium]|nr:ABC transporter permease [Candidatus Bipolaricaulota bacterium]